MLLIKQVGVYLNILNNKVKRHFFDAFRKNGIDLTGEQYLVMDTLWDDGILSQQAIADIIQKDKNSVTKFIDSLEKKGLVIRSVDQNDRRVNNIILTKKGKDLRLETTKVAISTMNGILKDISTEDLTTFVKVLEKIKNNINNIEL